MKKIFFFYRRNPNNGLIIENDIVDADERTAWNYWRNGRHFKYLGWSDGRFLLEAGKKIEQPQRNQYGMLMAATDEAKITLLEAAKKEIEFAKTNEDKAPPRDLTKKGLTPRDEEDDLLMNRVRGFR